LVGDVRQLAGELHASALSLVDLVTNVLDVTRFDTDKLELRETEFPVAALLEEEVRQATPLADVKHLKIEVERLLSPIWVRADRIKLGRVIGNLLSNAIKFTDKGHIRITTRRINDGSLQIAITDTGIGITPDNLTRIFDEFFQITDAGRSKGSGLGLAICKRLIDAMGGEIQVRSKPGDGSTFTVTLPSTAIVHRPETAAVTPAK
jgi:signal transduction histidine kinase